MRRCHLRMSSALFASVMKLKSMSGMSGTKQANGRAVGPTAFRWVLNSQAVGLG